MRQQWFLTLHEQPAIKVSNPICYVMKGPEVARKWMGKSWGMKWGISVYYLYGTVKINSSGPNIRLSATCNQSVVPGSLDMLKSTNQSSATGDMVSQPFVLAGLLLDHGLHFRGQHLQSPDNFRDRQRERSVCVCVCVLCVKEEGVAYFLCIFIVLPPGTAPFNGPLLVSLRWESLYGLFFNHILLIMLLQLSQFSLFARLRQLQETEIIISNLQAGKWSCTEVQQPGRDFSLQMTNEV